MNTLGPRFTVKYTVEGSPIIAVGRLHTVQVAHLLGTLACQNIGKVVATTVEQEPDPISPNDLLLEASHLDQHGISYADADAFLRETLAEAAREYAGYDTLDLYAGRPDI